MNAIVPQLPWSVKEKMRKRFRRCKSAAVRLRYLIIFNLLQGRGAYETAEVLDVHNTTVYRVAARFREHGECSLWDGREDNGRLKLSEVYLGILDQVVRSSPQDHGWRRPTWTWARSSGSRETSRARRITSYDPGGRGAIRGGCFKSPYWAIAAPCVSLAAWPAWRAAAQSACTRR